MGGVNVTKVQGVGKVLRELLLGKFLIGAEILSGLDSFFFSCESCCNGNALLCAALVPLER